MKKKLLAILVGTHENGATAAMLNCAVNAAELSGWEVTTIWLYQKHLSFCKGCRSCIKTGKFITDDFPSEFVHTNIL